MPQAHGTPLSLSAVTSSAAKIAATPVAASASAFPIATISAWAWGERTNTA